jgi:hypothetical protein
MMDWRAWIFLGVAAVAGALLLGLGAWIFLIAEIASPAVMTCGALTLALTGLAWHRHRRAMRGNLSNLSMDSVSEPR